MPEPGATGAAAGGGAGAWIRGHVALAAGGVGVAVLAIVAAAIVLGGPKPSPSPSPSAAAVTPAPSTTPTPKPLPPPIPTGLTAHAVIPTEVDLTWSAPAPGAVVTGYQVLRDDDLVHVLPADAVAYRDLGTAPNTTYSYSVVAIGPGGPSDGAKAAATTGAMPPATEARFDGQWTVSSKATAANAGDVKTGATRVDTWTVTPSCTAGSCDVTVANVLQRTVTASLARSDTGYAGTLAETWTDPKCGPVHETIDITVAPTAAGFDLAGEPLVERIEGTADVTVKPDGGTCDPATVTWSLTGVAVPPDLGSLLDPKLQCASPAAKPDLVHWKDAVATAGCTGTAGPITFYQYLTASAAEAAFRAFVGINTSGAAGCIAATPAAGYGPWARPGTAENAGDVACGPPQGGAAGAWVYTWTDWDHAIVGYAQWTDSKALRDLWASPESWLAP